MSPGWRDPTDSPETPDADDEEFLSYCVAESEVRMSVNAEGKVDGPPAGAEEWVLDLWFGAADRDDTYGLVQISVWRVRGGPLPSLEELRPFVGRDECTEWAEAVVHAFPGSDLRWEAGAYLKDGRLRDHAWAVAPDGTIVDTTHGQFVRSVPVMICCPGSREHRRYLAADDMTDEQRRQVYGDP